MAETTIASEATTQGQDQSPPIDLTALSDIATNGVFANQMLGEITKALDGLTSIVMPVPSGGTGRDTLTDHAVLIGAGTNPVNFASPSATTGVALVSQGASSDPVFGLVSLTAGVTGTLPVANGGMGGTSHTAYAVLCGGTTTTNPIQSVASVGTSGQVLTSNGAGALPTFQTKTIAVGASFTFKSPENETVALILNAAFPWTITQTNTITEVGTATVQVKIGTTNLGGGSNAASTTLNTVAHSTANAVSATNQINVTFTSTSSTCENLCLTIWGTRDI